MCKFAVFRTWQRTLSYPLSPLPLSGTSESLLPGGDESLIPGCQYLTRIVVRVRTLKIFRVGHFMT